MEKRTFAGLEVVVENPAGSSRQWHDRAAGKSGATTMRHDYGFLADHMGSDGDEVDCYLGPDEGAQFAHVVHQLAAPDFKRHDEDKVMLGFADEAAAKAAYLAHRDDGDRAYGGMTSMPLERFKSKLSRRTGDGKIRHSLMAWDVQVWFATGDDFVTEARGLEHDAALREARVYQSDAKGVRIVEGDKIKWLKKPREMSAPTRAWVAFEAGPREAGKVGAGKWDRICVPGHDEKDGQSTDFNLETLTQMAGNFEDRGDQVPIDHNHQSNYASQNGQPALALGFYGAVAVVAGGKPVKLAVARDFPTPLPGSSWVPCESAREAAASLAGKPDGLWGFRSVVTEEGDRQLPNFAFVSPTFTTEGTTRDGREIGYQLAAVAATNTPWQSETEINFSKGAPAPAPEKPAAVSGNTQGENQMAKKLGKLAALMTSKFGVKFDAADPEDKEVKAKMESTMEDTAMAAASDDKFDYAGMAGKFEEAAKAYEDAHFEDDGDEGEPPHATMRRMAAKFRKLSAPAEAPPAAMDAADGDKEKQKMADEKDKADAAKMATMEATNRSLIARLEKLEAEDAARKADEAKSAQVRFESLADKAIAGGYPKEDRSALIEFARSNYDAARKTVAHFLPKTGAPDHLFDRLSQNGGPKGGDTRAREDQGSIKPRRVQSMGLTFVEDDSAFAEEVKKTAESTDPATAAEVDKYIAPEKRAVKFERLLASERIVRAKRPDLARAADEAQQ